MVGRRLISGRQALGIEKDMREGLYAHLLRLSFGFYDRHQTGQLMSRATVDLQSVRFFLGFGLIFFFQHVLTVVSVMAVLFVVEWRLALIALAITPVIVAVAYRYSHVSHPVLREVQQKLGDVATVTEESIVGVHVVKAFAQEERRQAEFERASGAVFAQTVRAFRQRALYVPLLSFLPLLAQGAVLLAAGRMVVDGSLDARPVLRLQPAAGDADRAAAQPRDVDRPGAARDRLGRADLRGDGRARGRRRPARRRRAARAARRDPLRAASRFGYAPDRPVLEEIDLELAPGRTVALIGHTGSGKTTLAALVPRFYDATEGRVLVDGVDVRDVTRRSLRREIGVISQDPFLFSATRAREHRLRRRSTRPTSRSSGPRARRRRTSSSLELPQGYDTVIGERGITLSGGQRQRLAIARALVIDPRILILDDATASVDATTEARIRDGLAEAMRGRTTIIIAHRLSTIALADEIVVLDHGRRRRARHARRAARDERRLPRDPRARPAPGPAEGDRVKVWQPGGHLSEERGGEVRDWSWRRTRRRLGLLVRLDAPVPAAARRSRSRRCSPTRSSRSRRRTWRSSRSTRGSATATSRRLTWIVALFLVAAVARARALVARTRT